MKLVLIIVMIVCCNVSYAQLNSDSIRISLQKEKKDSASILKQLRLIETVYSTETEPLLVIGRWGLENAEKLKNRYLQAYANLALGFAYLYTGNITGETGIYFTSALKIAEADNYYDISAQAYNGLAHVYGLARQNEKYIEFTLKSIEASRKAGMPIGISHGYTGLAVTLYSQAKDPETMKKVIGYQQEAITVAEKLQDSLTLIVYYQNISNYYAEIKAFDSASLYLERSKRFIDKTGADNDNMSYYYWKGSLFFKKREYSSALESYTTAVSYAQKYGSRSFENRIYRAMIKNFKETGEFKKALFYLEQTKAFDDSLLTKENFAKAADIQNKYEREKKDNEINRLNADHRIHQLESEKQKAIIAGNLLEARKKEAEIGLLSRERELQELRIRQQNEELERNMLRARADSQQILLARQDKVLKEKQLGTQRMVRNYLLAGLGLLGLLSFVLSRSIRAKNKAYTQLENKSIQIKEQALQLSKQAKLIAQFQSQMNPHFVYNALHNIQGLVLGHETQKANMQIQSLAQLMRKTFANAEKDDIPVEEEVSYLQKYIDFEKTAFDAKLDFEIKVNKEAENVLIPPMMIQPFVENSIKHAGLEKIENPYIRVLIGVESNLLAISVKDNGTGIRKNISEMDRLSHSVSVIKSRLNLLFNGNANVNNNPVFSIRTVPEIPEGTAVKFYLPLNYSY